MKAHLGKLHITRLPFGQPANLKKRIWSSTQKACKSKLHQYNCLVPFKAKMAKVPPGSASVFHTVTVK